MELSKIYYLSTIDFIRVSVTKISKLKRLLHNQDIEKIDEFLEKQDNEEILHRRLLKAYPNEVKDYYKYKDYSFHTAFRLLEALFKLQEDKFPSRTAVKKLTDELLLFNDNLIERKPTTIVNSPLIILTGQNEKVRYSDYRGANYLDYLNIKRIVQFFDNTQIHTKPIFFEELAKVLNSDYSRINVINYRKFFIQYNQIGKTIKLEDDIWTIDEDDWKMIKTHEAAFLVMLEHLQNLYQVFKHSLKFKNDWILIRHYFV